MNDVITVVSKYGAIVTEKEFLALLGIQCGECRRPFTPLPPQARDEIKVAYEKHLCQESCGQDNHIHDSVYNSTII